MEMGPKIALEEGLDLRQLQSSGSVLHINTHYDGIEIGTNLGETDTNMIDILGEPIKDFKVLNEKLTAIDTNGFVKKLIFEEGGGMPIDDDFTVYVAFSAYWENDNEPFDVVTFKKPLEVNLKDNGILPGLEIAIKTMLVGELSLFLFSHEVMYGELGIPPRIKPKSQCVFYIKLLKSVLTPKQRKLCLSEPNMFVRVRSEVASLLSSGVVAYKINNFALAVSIFKKAVNMLHKCRLADEAEEEIQKKLLKKLYNNSAICYNKLKQPLKACIACNELNRLDNLWNNEKALLQNARALRMIGEYDNAKMRLRKAFKLSPDNKELKAEMELLKNTRDSCNQSKLLCDKILGSLRETIDERFKEEVDKLIKNFKANADMCKLTLPQGLNADEMQYVKDACIRENLFFNKISRADAMSYATHDKNEGTQSKSEETLDHSFVMDKESVKSVQSELTLDQEMLHQLDLMISLPQLFISTQK